MSITSTPTTPPGGAALETLLAGGPLDQGPTGCGRIRWLFELHPDRARTLEGLAQAAHLPLADARLAVAHLLARGELVRTRGAGEYYARPAWGEEGR